MSESRELMRQLRIGIQHNEELRNLIYRKTSILEKPRDRNIVLESLGLYLLRDREKEAYSWRNRDNIKCQPVVSNKDLSEKYGISKTQISTIINDKFSRFMLRDLSHWKLIIQHLDMGRLGMYR